MFAFLIRKSLANRLFVLCGTLVLFVLGYYQMQQVPVDVLPEIDRNTVSLITEGEGLAPEEVERRITFPIETAVQGLKDVERVRSISTTSLSIVFVDFELGTDIYRSRQLVSERMNVVEDQLPADVEAQMAPISSAMGMTLSIAITSDSGNMMALRDFTDWFLRPRLMSIPGVAQVLIVGGEARQLRVTPDLRMMDLLDVSHGDVEAAVRSYNANTGGDTVDHHGRRFFILNVGREPDLERLLDGMRNLVVNYVDGRAVLLQQVAKVKFQSRVKRGDGGYMGKPAVVMRLMKQPGVNTIRLTEDVQKMLAELRPYLPKGIHADQIMFRQSKFIETSVDNLREVLQEAVAIVAITLFLFLLNFRTTAISLTAIPVSFIITILVFWLLDMTINTMTLGGLAIAVGELVDDAVVGVENIVRRLKQNTQLAQPRPILEVVSDATVEVRSGIFYATLIMMLVFFPLFWLPGIEGLMFTPLAVGYVISILASLVTSITLTPVLAYYLLPGLKQVKEATDGALVLFLKRNYERALHWAFDYRKTVISGVVGGITVAALVVGLLPRAFLPPLNEGMYVVFITLKPGISLTLANRVGSVAERLLLGVPEVESVGRVTGRAEMALHADGIYQTEIDVDISQEGRPVDEVLANMRARLAMLPGRIFIGQPLAHRLNVILSGLPSQLAIKIYGDDLSTLVRLADQLRDRLDKVAGLTDLKVEMQARIPQVRVYTEPESSKLYGITPAKLTEELETLSAGRLVSQVIDEMRRYDVVIRLDDQDRSREGLQQLLIDTPVGRVSLRDLAEVVNTDGPNQIIRDNGRRRIAILANTDGSDMKRIAEGIHEQATAMVMPEGYFVAIEGTYEAQQEATLRIAVLSIISVMLTFAVLYSRYRSAILSLIIIGNVPLALIGSVVTIWLVGGSLSLATMIGFITLAGISTRNGILKISHYINLCLHEGESFGPAMIIRGSLERMTPVLMTAVSAMLALVPLMMGVGDPGKEILAPVAQVIFGGLVSATLLDAVLTPILFLSFGEKPLLRLLAQRETDVVVETY